mmetsp:Transcript_10954/g.12518  ORF Transcript_10954/g.12518 Transcript_10954/m.12518 type:complete len:317 (+) Transcript_10954:93-1043(+)
METVPENELILHHYSQSPFSEKIRILLGIKNLKWRSLEVPMVNKGRITSIWTGGYRRIPVLQIGAEFFCDTELIAKELERRFPTSSFNATQLSTIGGEFFNRTLFNCITVGMFSSKPTSSMLEDIDLGEFFQDRMQLIGDAANNQKVKGKNWRTVKNQLLSHLNTCEDLLGDGRKFLTGNEPSLLDASAYAQFWFMKRLGIEEINGFVQIGDYIERMASFGHGRSSPISIADARSVAKMATLQSDGLEYIPRSIHVPRNETVGVRPEEFGDFDVMGILKGSTFTKLVLERNDSDLGRSVLVHFPHRGYYVRMASKL